ncbi:hypothetical protein LCGC14_0427140 [marine sediment metagenome]|uniref:Uncharacterized protein n=1 Tax=marine sediment metagenome TaxID=412755 RepID=A0A0F9T7B3_9ZZZZ
MKLTEEELKALQGTQLTSITMKLKSDTATVESGRALAEARVAELEYENTLLKIYLHYGLTDNHIINETTGLIKAKKEENDDDTSTESQDDQRTE